MSRVIRIGNYRLGRTLGEGSFGKVKRAYLYVYMYIYAHICCCNHFVRLFLFLSHVL